MGSAIIAGRLNRERIKGYACPLALGLLILFHLVNNWLYLRANVTLVGWDAISHLGKTLIYNSILQRIDLRSIFHALTWPWNRPPLPWLPAVLFYRLFGISTDVALMSNIVYLVILVLSVYRIGKCLYSARMGLLTAFLVSTFPVLFSLSRILYPDFALTAMVALSISLLIGADGFKNRKHSLLWGLSVGLGLLTKWQFLAFATAPALFIALRTEAWRDLQPLGDRSDNHLFLGRVSTSFWAHLAAALLLVSTWYLPNRDRIETFALGFWLLPISWILLTITFHLLSKRPSPATNFWSAIFLGMVIGSVWSLPNLTYAHRFLYVAYGGINIAGREFTFLEPIAYTRYLHYFIFEQISPLYFVAFVLAITVWWHYRLRGSPLRSALKGLSDNAWVIILWFIVPLTIFTFSLTMNPRFTVALLPAPALVTARGLLMVKNARVKSLFFSLLVAVGLFQFFVLSYDGLAWLGDEATWHLPLVGEVSLLARGGYIQTPNRGETDSRYWVAPEILQSLQEMAKVRGQRVKLGLLVNNRHLNGDILNYLILLEYDGVELMDLARGRVLKPIYPHIFESDFLLLTDGSLEDLCEEAKEALERVKSEPSAFNEAFQLWHEYELPNGEVISLYRRYTP